MLWKIGLACPKYSVIGGSAVPISTVGDTLWTTSPDLRTTAIRLGTAPALSVDERLLPPLTVHHAPVIPDHVHTPSPPTCGRFHRGVLTIPRTHNTYDDDERYRSGT